MTLKEIKNFHTKKKTHNLTRSFKFPFCSSGPAHHFQHNTLTDFARKSLFLLSWHGHLPLPFQLFEWICFYIHTPGPHHNGDPGPHTVFLFCFCHIRFLKTDVTYTLSVIIIRIGIRQW